jgi:WD40 repeat protein
MYTSGTRIWAGLLVFMMVLGGILGSTSSARELFCAVGWEGEFTHIDPTFGRVAPTRTDLPIHLQSLARSPDGTLFAGREGMLYTVDPFTGYTTPFLPIDLDLRGMAFSASGELYVTGGEMGDPDTLQIINIKDGTYRSSSALWGDVNEVQGLAFSPKGKLYGVAPTAQEDGTYDLFTIDLDDGQTHLLGSHKDASLDQSLVFTPDGRLFALGQRDTDDGTISSFARLDPRNGSSIGPVFTFAGDYRGLELVPEPATLLLLGLGALVALSCRR